MSDFFLEALWCDLVSNKHLLTVVLINLVFSLSIQVLNWSAGLTEPSQFHIQTHALSL